MSETTTPTYLLRFYRWRRRQSWRAMLRWEQRAYHRAVKENLWTIR